jgi:hypothetical protein
MKNSSALQLELNYTDGSVADIPIDDKAERVRSSPSHEAGASSGAVNFPSFSGDSQVYAITARIAGRMNAATVSNEEHESLLRERQNLLDRELAGNMTRKEEIRLEYVRWSLDRVEDAKYGQSLDVMEGYVNRYEQFLADVRDLERQLVQLKRKR